MELCVDPCKASFDYILRFEKAGSDKFVCFTATMGDLIQFRDAINSVLSANARPHAEARSADSVQADVGTDIRKGGAA
jgi:hypothetical protein